MSMHALLLLIGMMFWGCSKPPAQLEIAQSNPMQPEPSIKLPAEAIKTGLHVDLKFSGDILVSRDGQTYKESYESNCLRKIWFT